MKKILILLFILNCSFALTQTTPVYFDPSQPINTRVNDLISKLSLEEKVSQMMNNSPAIDRLNIPAYNWWSEALHGVARSGIATVFPQTIGMAATFDDSLIFQISSAISDEARAMFNAATAEGYHQRYGGLTFWTPNVNIFRDPRWGRGQETYGEDPYLTSRMASMFVKGLQGNNPDYLKVAACAKHFAVHSGPERLRHEFNAMVSDKDLRETYLPAFKALVDAHVEAVMCAYNRMNNQPCCANSILIDQILRKEWGFKGHIVTDCDALEDFYKGHNVVPGQPEAAALAIQHGINLNCGNVYSALVDAVKKGLVSEKEIDSALAVLLRTRFKLGLFDPEGKNPYNSIPTSVINSPQNRALSKKAAEESIILLKNNGVLPLKNDLAKYFVTGPNATSVEVLFGNYYGVNPHMVTILEGISSGIKTGSQIEYKQGFLLDRANINPIDWTTGDAKESSATFVVMGLSGLLEGEEGESIASEHFGDRLDYNIPKNQIDFLKKLKEGNKKPIIAIITGGSPMNLAEVSELADAVLLVWYPGEEGGNAVSDIVFGKTSPSGRLPVTFPKSLDQLPAYEDYSMKGRTYRYMTAEPMYPFGYGLSYTKFDYSPITLSAPKIKKSQSVTAEVTVANTGNFESDEIVQLYLTTPQTESAPIYSLKDFKRIHLKAGESAKVSFNITPQEMNAVNQQGESVLIPGTYKVFISGSVPSERSKELGITNIKETTFTLK